MKKGFTLLELIIVIIILGVLATLGFTQYGRMVERARGAEARAILGDVRKFAAAYKLEYGNLTGMLAANVNIGAPGSDMIPNGCGQSSHYFSYAINTALTPPYGVNVTATRCVGGGKLPTGTAPAGTLSLWTNTSSGIDNWSSPNGY